MAFFSSPSSTAEARAINSPSSPQGGGTRRRASRGTRAHSGTHRPGKEARVCSRVCVKRALRILEHAAARSQPGRVVFRRAGMRIRGKSGLLIRTSQRAACAYGRLLNTGRSPYSTGAKAAPRGIPPLDPPGGAPACPHAPPSPEPQLGHARPTPDHKPQGARNPGRDSPPHRNNTALAGVLRCSRHAHGHTCNRNWHGATGRRIDAAACAVK